MELKSDPRVAGIFSDYPKEVASQMNKLRSLVLEAASEVETLDALEETLKWGEPSYLTKYGSTVRMDWKAKSPGQYAVYFKCTSQLVPTFKTIYKDLFTFETNRAIVFKLNEPIPKKQLKHCIKLALTYHKVKHLPLLGT
jgi:hypothetical protein